MTASRRFACCTVCGRQGSPRVGRRIAGEILGAFEALAPGRIEHGDREGGAAGLVDGTRRRRPDGCPSAPAASLRRAATRTTRWMLKRSGNVDRDGAVRRSSWLPVASRSGTGLRDAVGADAELDAVVRLFEDDELRLAVEQGEEDGGRRGAQCAAASTAWRMRGAALVSRGSVMSVL